jgi:hypothetical protein
VNLSQEDDRTGMDPPRSPHRRTCAGLAAGDHLAVGVVCGHLRRESGSVRVQEPPGPRSEHTESGCGTAITLISPLAASLAEGTCPAVSVLNMS